MATKRLEFVFSVCLMLYGTYIGGEVGFANDPEVMASPNFNMTPARDPKQ